ncbi:hypothetical protein P153DRAFT_362778 [Dothidotthia symphoricarpi CBS 119687]|uniref:Uncharacterized protein n=1 Tax=Dothidotthia symphoricarpi CBS 119687 TaxID=1392245 RepID=A0A6A6API0_9PLEO|nr:uncharacterized protein P153DRAFT_362778 [Dothidotthia symphoricarpi CBS 119687]KAF2133700.1 hypothetical protein P153DRAFT_362778 [Dothidotthia symphoricarpi CBS 119687]
MPYLTSIIKPYATDYMFVDWYIIRPLQDVMVMVVTFLSHILAGDTALAAVTRAEARRNFEDKVLAGASNLHFKQEMLRIPFDEFFDTYAQVYPNNTIMLWDDARTWLWNCASHPGADLDGALVAAMTKYEERFLFSGSAHQTDLNSTSGMGPFPSLTQVLRIATEQSPPLGVKDIVDVVRQVIQVAMNAVDVWILTLNMDPSLYPRLASRTRDEGERLIHLAFSTALEDPYSNVSLPAKEVLAKTDISSMCESLVSGLVPNYLDCGTESENLHFAVYACILDSAVNVQVSQNADAENLIDTAIETGFSFPPSRRSERVQLGFRPDGYRDQISRELQATFDNISIPCLSHQPDEEPLDD